MTQKTADNSQDKAASRWVGDAVSDDRLWFAAHPDRASRIRRPDFAELATIERTFAPPLPFVGWWMVVHRNSDGSRSRRPFFGPHSLTCTEDLARSVWCMALDTPHDQPVGIVLPPEGRA